MDNTFELGGRTRMVLLIGMVIGVVCMALTFFSEDPLHARFWSNMLHNSVFFLGIGFISMFLLAAFTTAYAGWYTVFKRVWEAYSLFLIPGLVLMLVLVASVWGHWHHMYHWADADAVAKDPILQHKSAFLNKWWYTLGTIICVGAWAFFAYRMRALSLQEDEQGTDRYKIHRRLRIIVAIAMPIGAFSSAAMIWQWIMSIDSHWYSTMFAWYTTASWFVSMMAMTILMLIWLKSKGYYQNVTTEHFHDLGKLLFAFSVFWTYLWFSQYMLIWYANVGEETIYFKERIDNYPVLFYANLVINFLLPFFVLMRNDTKRKAGTLVFASIFIFVGHWLDFFLMIKPGVYLGVVEHLSHAAHGAGDHGHHHDVVASTVGFKLPGLLEIGTFIGFLCFFLYFTLGRLASAKLEPQNDPYYAESLHHHT